MTRDDRQNQDAFEDLVREHQDQVFRVALSVLGPGHEAEAEDVAQEVFIKVYKRWEKFRGESAVSTWLHRIAVNAAIEKTRLARFRKPHVSEVEIGAPGAHSDPDAHVIRLERKRAVLGCLESLPPSYRSTVTLHYWMGHTVDEISGILGVPSGTIKARLSRGRTLLGRCLEGKGLDHHDD